MSPPFWKAPRLLGCSRSLAVALSFVVWVVQSLPLGRWLVDDAGISFVYARNLVHGHGLVSQALQPPVEGFSNPLWTFLLAPCFIDDPVDPTFRIKLLSALLVLGTFVVLRGCLRSLLPPTAGEGLTLGLLTLLALNTSFVVWTTSGLENPLTALLTGLFIRTLVVQEDGGYARPVVTGLLLAALALTRPEAVVLLAVMPMWSILRRFLIDGQGSSRRIRLTCVASATALGALVVTVTLRWLYFSALLPNTYQAKGGPGVRELVGLLTFSSEVARKSYDVLNSVFGPVAGYVAIGMIVFTARWLRPGPFRDKRLLTLLTLIFSWASYVLLPSDWMGEIRFATSTIVILALVFVCVVGDLAVAASQRWVALGAIGVVLISAIVVNGPRLVRFASDPTVPFQGVADRYGLVFNLYADRLGIDEASLACPDVGGTLYFSRHVVMDLGGLCHREIAGALTRGPGSLQDLILHRLQPTFIHVHGVWSERYRLDEAPRFAHDYVQIHRAVSLQQTPAGPRLHESGDWVRRDAVRDSSRLLGLQTEVEESWTAFLNEARLHRLPFPRDPTPAGAGRPTLLPLNGS